MKVFLYFLQLIFSVCILCDNVLAETFSLTGDWNYQNTGDATDQFSENYSINVGKNIDLTEAMSLGASLHFNRTKGEELTKEILSPSVTYLINNDLFTFNLSGTASEEFDSQKSENSSRSLGANWSSVWDMGKWVPSVVLNYNQNWLEDDQDPKRVDSDATSTGMALNWDFLLSKLFYTYNLNLNNDNLSGQKGEANSHFGRYQTTRSFWDKRGSVSFSQQYSTNSNENTLPVSGGIALLQVAVSGFADDISPDLLAGGAYSLSTNSNLTDGDTSTAAVITDNDADSLHIGFRTNYQTVTTLYLYTDSTLQPTVSGLFNWDLYSSSANATWIHEKTGLTASYDMVNNRFKIDISGFSQDYLSVVATNDAGATLVNFSEMAVYREIAASGDTTLVKNSVTNHKTAVGLSFKITPVLRLTSNFDYEQNIISSGTDSNNTTVSSGLNWSPNDDVTIRLNGNFTSRRTAKPLRDQTRSYHLSVAFPVIPSVDTAWGISLSELYEGTRQLSASYNTNLQAVAALYEDLDARFNVSFRQNEDKIEDSITQSTQAKMTLTARLIPGLVADLSSNYSKSSGQAPSVGSTANLHWRVSEMLSVTGNYAQSWASSDKSSASLGFNLALTQTMQVSLSHSRKIRPNPSHVTSMDWKWTISQYISMLTSGSYEKGEDSEVWSVAGQLRARFSIM